MNTLDLSMMLIVAGVLGLFCLGLLLGLMLQARRPSSRKKLPMFSASCEDCQTSGVWGRWRAIARMPVFPVFEMRDFSKLICLFHALHGRNR
jgi:hypothetical protein